MSAIIVRRWCFVTRKLLLLVQNVTAVSLTNLSTPANNNHTGEVPKMVGKLAGFGNPLLDITVQIQNDSILKKYNLNRDDQKEITIEEMNKLLNDIAQ